MKEQQAMRNGRMDEEEKIYSLMMEALDGELAAAGRAELEAHLRARPDLAREWRMMRLVDDLLKEAPILSPAADFAQRTVARLPRSRTRMRTLAILYALLLLGGVLPIVGLVWLSARLSLGAVLGGLLQAGEAVGALALRVGAAFGQIVVAVGEQASRQPGAWGWLFVMIGLVVLWGGVYQVLMRAPDVAATVDR
jgi:anti-sigma factor RsiW